MKELTQIKELDYEEYRPRIAIPPEGYNFPDDFSDMKDYYLSQD